MNKEELINVIKTTQEDYRNGDAKISDIEYDNLVEKLRKIDPANELLNIVEPEKFDRPTIKYSTPMLSIEKVYSVEDLQKWFNRIEKKHGKLSYRVTQKLDGMAAKLKNGKLSSRGDGYIGYDITDAWDKGLKLYGDQLSTGIGEIVMDKYYFEDKLKNDFEHPRNCIVGAIKCDVLSSIQKQTLDAGVVYFVPYNSLNGYIGNSDNIIKYLDTIIKKLSNFIFPVDGYVIEVYNNEKVKQELGNTSHHYRWQVAYKTITETAITKVENIVWQTGKGGAITPILEISPIKLSGAVIKRVTGHNYGFLVKNRIGVGTEIEIVRSGEVIPKVINTINHFNQPVYPKNCPCCQHLTNLDKDIVKCINLSCLDQVVGRIRYFFEILRIDLFGKKSIEKIVRNGPEMPYEVLNLTEEEYLSMGFGKKQSKNFVQSIKKALTYEYEDYKIIASLSIPTLGRGDARKLLKNYTIEELLTIDQKYIENINGFGEIKAEEIYNGLQNKYFFIKILQDKFKIITTKKEKEKMNNLLNGKKFVFTGKMENKREKMKDFCSDGYGVAQSGISKATDYLVCGESVGKKKIEKAKKYNVNIITEEKFMKMINIK